MKFYEIRNRRRSIRLRKMEKYPFLFAIIKRCEIQIASCVLASSDIGFVKIINEFRVEKNNKILKEFKAHHRSPRSS